MTITILVSVMTTAGLVLLAIFFRCRLGGLGEPNCLRRRWKRYPSGDACGSRHRTLGHDHRRCIAKR